MTTCTCMMLSKEYCIGYIHLQHLLNTGNQVYFPTQTHSRKKETAQQIGVIGDAAQG